jgi:hypothetical protein
MKCTPFRGGLGEHQITGFVCGPRQKARECRFCHESRQDGRLCDWPREKGGGTCDAFMCVKCARNVGPNLDYCPPHAKKALALSTAVQAKLW